MKRIIVLLLISGFCCSAKPQAKTELYELVKKLITDSTGYENIGDWAVGQPKKYPVNWKSDRIEMSPDTSINFFRMGTAELLVNGRTLTQSGQPAKWSIMLKGPRMGYGSFSILSTPGAPLGAKPTLDSVFGKRSFRAKLLRACAAQAVAGYHFYELKIPGKDLVFLKLSWIAMNNHTALRVDVFDAYSRHAAKLACPN